MPPRAMWTGQLRLSLVSFGVRMYAATESSQRVAMNQLHKDCNQRVRNQLVCPTHGPISRDDLVKGYEYEKGTYSIGTGRENLAEFQAAREESLAFLREMPLSAWDRTAEHHVVGTLQIKNLMNLWTFHDLSHIRQIAELIKATRFWDGIGPLQRYYSVSP